MTFRMKKPQFQELGLQTEAVQKRQADFEKALRTFNRAVTAAFAPVNEARDALNKALMEVRENVADFTRTHRDEFASKSEKWQESEKANKADQWICGWEQYGESFADVEADEPEAFDPDLPDIGEMPEEAP